MEILVFGNADYAPDSLPLRLLPRLRREFPHVRFREFDTAEGLERAGRELLILDTVVGLDRVRVLEAPDGLGSLEDSPRCTLHDFDLGFSLKLMKKAGMLDRATIIGVPEGASRRDALRGVMEILYGMAGEARTETLGGKEYKIVRIATKNRRASARLVGGMVIVKVPIRWPKGEAEKIAGELERKALGSIGRGAWGREGMAALDFSGCERVRLLGKEYRVVVRGGARNSCCLIGDAFVATLKAPARRNALLGRAVAGEMLHEAALRVRALNARHFNAEIRDVRLRDAMTRWGSWHRGKVSLNIRLLFGPLEILDYVIVHELAHSRVGGHTQRYWAVVERAMPDYAARRKWLRENGHLLGPGFAVSGLECPRVP